MDSGVLRSRLYQLDVNLCNAIRLEAASQNRKQIEIVREALTEYVDRKRSERELARQERTKDFAEGLPPKAYQAPQVAIEAVEENAKSDDWIMEK